MSYILDAKANVNDEKLHSFIYTARCVYKFIKVLFSTEVCPDFIFTKKKKH